MDEDSELYDAGMMAPFVVNEPPSNGGPADNDDWQPSEHGSFSFWDDQSNWIDWVDADGTMSVSTQPPAATTQPPAATGNPIGNVLKGLVEFLLKPGSSQTARPPGASGSGSGGQGSSGFSSTSNAARQPTPTTTTTTTTPVNPAAAPSPQLNAATVLPVAAAIIYLLK